MIYNEKIEMSLLLCEYDDLIKEDKELVDKSKEATKNAYAPYSKFHVGAALLMENGEIITGSNQENAAYTNGICAERVAIFHANHKHPNLTIKKLVISVNYNDDFIEKIISPCGACRQVLLESEIRQNKDIEVILYSKKSIIKIKRIKDLLPLGFSEAAFYLVFGFFMITIFPSL